jgi:hypothetical protein
MDACDVFILVYRFVDGQRREPPLEEKRAADPDAE